MDPTLPGLLLQAARDVAAVRQAVNTTARSAATAGVSGWLGGAASRHLMELSQLQIEVNRAVNAIAALENGLGNAAATARQTVADEAEAARAAAQAGLAGGAAGQVQGPPWPGAGYPSY